MANKANMANMARIAGSGTRGRRMMWALPALLVVATLVLAGCSLPGVPGASAAKPDPATILRNAQTANLRDATFTLTGTFMVTLPGSSSPTSVTATGTGKLTTTPKRADLTLNVDADGTQVGLEVLTDSASGNGYIAIPALTSLFGSSTATYLELPIGSLGIDTTIYTNFMQLTKPTLLDDEQLGGVAVWHLQGQQSFSLGTAREDFFVRQDNYLPAKVTIQGAAGATLNITLTFTAVNSGLSIPLPTASEVIGG